MLCKNVVQPGFGVSILVTTNFLVPLDSTSVPRFTAHTLERTRNKVFLRTVPTKYKDIFTRLMSKREKQI